MFSAAVMNPDILAGFSAKGRSPGGFAQGNVVMLEEVPVESKLSQRPNLEFDISRIKDEFDNRSAISSGHIPIEYVPLYIEPRATLPDALSWMQSTWRPPTAYVRLM